MFAIISVKTIIRAHISAPITNPHINKLPTEVPERVPYKIMPIPGGISGVIVEEKAVITAEKGFDKPDFSIGGTKIFASIAASATEEPLIPPIMVDKRMFA